MSSIAPDIYLGIYADVHGWGGGVSYSRGLSDALRACGLTTKILGIGGSDRAAEDASCFEPANVPATISPRYWRIRSWLTTGALRDRLRRMPRPRVGFIGVSPFWVVAAKRAWPTADVVFGYPCLLSHCLPFTWPAGQRGSLWRRVDFAAIRRVERLALRLADYTTAPTQESEDELTAYGPRVRGRIIRCDYGVATINVEQGQRRKARRELSISDETHATCVLGACDRNKGFDLAIGALSKAADACHLIVVGDGPDLPGLRRLAAERGVSERVRFVGAQRDVAGFYAAADCVLSTSHYDTFPNTLLEAMRVGRPILAPRHDPPRVYAGMASVVREHGTGLVYDRHESALANCMTRLARDRELAARLGRRGMELMEGRYRWSDTARSIVSRCGWAKKSAQSPGKLAASPQRAPVTV